MAMIEKKWTFYTILHKFSLVPNTNPNRSLKKEKKEHKKTQKNIKELKLLKASVFIILFILYFILLLINLKTKYYSSKDDFKK
tara:strand:+ start:69 stop:317 length:249 start_codon:yes stop_codon:yes gene_type:complete